MTSAGNSPSSVVDGITTAPSGAAGEITTTTSVGAKQASGGKPASDSLPDILWFGVGVLVMIAIVYLVRGKLNVTFARIYALVVIAVLAVALAFSNVSDTALTAAFTLLGTVAGYLAGAKAQHSTVPAGGNGATVPPVGPDGGDVGSARVTVGEPYL